ncbi:N-acetylmuramoyl-L-alanine amidase, partial [candidate division KSB1 bacterium]|nr:N-acetylmuramoyl-L-alanine amidase [candidate division KSB1 bacterium]NIR71806.1 N-acetylmuramoyl-L-alanine amidase [candidate division KSB1 bacterium]NIS27260.1 N-acetylmuramoyl-L-alanine amidase [candidate division KSB1 bacterium]NIT74145.1 N-acetylmuramoyl-L-alanine amidase [candidate division KSB1 bacterium]NIU27994.1 N-acetylmuramoyl-L-alanine amidase [candidate division KSB1 bacterium]
MRFTRPKVLGVLPFIVVSLIPIFALAQELFLLDVPDSLRLKVVYPADGDTVSFDRVRYAGSALPSAKVWVQGSETRVYPSGAFVGLVDLEPGVNILSFTVRDSLGVLSDSLRMFRTPGRRSLPERPTSVNTSEVRPREDVHISPGDVLEVEFHASPAGRASFSIDKIVEDFHMEEASPANAGGLQGIYRGSVIIPPRKEYSPKPVEFKFRGKDGRELKFKSDGKVHVLSELFPLVAVTTDSLTVVRTEPGGEIWMELPVGIKMQITGEREGLKMVKLAEDVVGYVASNSLRMLPVGSPLPQASIGAIGALQDANWVQLRINISKKIPFRIQQFVEPAALEVVFYRARQAPQWIMYPEDDETVGTIQWRQESASEIVLRVELNQEQQWGFHGRYVGRQFRLYIRRAPRFSNLADSLLNGLTIVVDAGHGGEFEGAVSATGLLEKDVNLKFANHVATLLEAEGANVVRTRMQDTTVTLQKRLAIARDTNSHIFVSLHNNSISPATNPVRPRGTSTYYTVPQSAAIARKVYQRLLTLGVQPFGRVVSTYFVTRQTSLLSFLVEGLFMTHPEDEMLLMD